MLKQLIKLLLFILLIISQQLLTILSTSDISELPSIKTFKILGMSVYDDYNHNNDDNNDKSHWWKWFLPSYYQEHLYRKDLDITNDNKKYDNKSYCCQLRYYGFMKKLGSEGYWDGGYGTLSIPDYYKKTLKCYYQSAIQSHVNIGHGSKHLFERQQAAKQLMAFAIYCPLPKKRKNICEILNTKEVKNEIRLYPVGWEKTYMAYPPYEYLGI